MRGFAFAIDALLILLAVYAVLLLPWWTSGQVPSGNSDLRVERAALALVALAYTSTEFLWAVSLGKFLLRLRIRSQSGGKAEPGMLALRWSTKQLPWIACLLMAILPYPVFGVFQGFMETVLLAGALAALNDDHLAWHDQWSGTSVCHVRRSASDSPLSKVPASPAPTAIAPVA
jgi:uncharacterized RDD family membrane protein YckC